jgi:hypothetical protein
MKARQNPKYPPAIKVWPNHSFIFISGVIIENIIGLPPISGYFLEF